MKKLITIICVAFLFTTILYAQKNLLNPTDITAAKVFTQENQNRKIDISFDTAVSIANKLVSLGEWDPYKNPNFPKGALVEPSANTAYLEIKTKNGKEKLFCFTCNFYTVWIESNLYEIPEKDRQYIEKIFEDIFKKDL